VIGETIGGKYTVVRHLGEGGMGAVYEARHRGTGKRVALKVITGELGNDPRQVTRFEQEARAAGVIESDHIVQVFDAGRDEASGAPYLAMEYLVGEDVQQLFARLGPLPADLVLRIGLQACLGLEKAHAQGIVHRDIKPANLFLMERDSGERLVKVLDFGIAKIAPRALAPEQKKGPLTQAGTVIGSPLYMSPEQARGKEGIDHRTDVWSLGIVLYQALTGHTPFDGSASVGDFICDVCSTPVAPIATMAPWVERAVAQTVERALFIDPRDRYPTMTAMREAIAALLPQGATIHAAMLVPAAARIGSPSSEALAATAAGPSHGSVATIPELPSAAAMSSLLASTPATLATTPPLAVTPPPAFAPQSAVASAEGAPTALPPTTARPPPAALAPAELHLAPWIAGVLLLAAAGGLGGAYALGWLETDKRHGRSRSTEASAAPIDTGAATPPAHPLTALAGLWWSESGQSYNAVPVGETIELRVHDPEQFPGQGYSAGEASYILRTARSDPGSFRVEARVRPPAPRGTTYDHARSSASCVATWSEVSGKPLIAQLAIDRLVLQTPHLEPAASVFVREGSQVIRCAGLGDVRATEAEIILGRTPVHASGVGAACQNDGQCQSHDCAGHRCAAPRASGSPCTTDAQCASRRCQSAACR